MLLLRPFLLFPHGLWGALYAIIMIVMHSMSWITIVITGRNPQMLWDILEGYLGFCMSHLAYGLLLTDIYPSFTVDAEKRRGIAVEVDYPRRMNRLTVMFRFLLLVPHFVFCIGYVFPLIVLYVTAALSILFIKRLPEWQFACFRDFLFYFGRVMAYVLLLVDEYPPFNGIQPLSVQDRFPLKNGIGV